MSFALLLVLILLYLFINVSLCLTACCVRSVPRAADWKLDAPDWTGRMRLTARGKVAYVKLEDRVSGETGCGG